MNMHEKINTDMTVMNMDQTANKNLGLEGIWNNGLILCFGEKL